MPKKPDPELNRIALQKIPEITLGFWIIKIAATTFGETAGDAVTMTLNLGYAVGTAIFFALFLATATAQISLRNYHRFLYWAVVITTTTVGTTMADFADRSLGIGYMGGSLLLLAALIAVLAAWKLKLGAISFTHIADRRVEVFYWATILFSNTLGTALGDFAADQRGLGYEGGALLFSAAIAVIAALHFLTRLSPVSLFWSAFILTRPLGATVGDLLTKPSADGGLNLGRIASSLVLAVFIVGCVALLPSKKPARARS
jgi:uncharacterized membrane-anchored protein